MPARSSHNSGRASAVNAWSLTDLLHAARTLTHIRAFTAVCVVSLGLGMSVTIAVLLLTRFAISTPPGVTKTVWWNS